jgi:hypothetical protein
MFVGNSFRNSAAVIAPSWDRPYPYDMNPGPWQAGSLGQVPVSLPTCRADRTDLKSFVLFQPSKGPRRDACVRQGLTRLRSVFVTGLCWAHVSSLVSSIYLPV